MLTALTQGVAPVRWWLYGHGVGDQLQRLQASMGGLFMTPVPPTCLARNLHGNGLTTI